jgi:predicted cupin superfamily sugar epimerase
MIAPDGEKHGKAQSDMLNNRLRLLSRLIRAAMTVPEADRLIARLDLKPHPEGGAYRETFRDEARGGRALSTAILFLLKAGEVSHWHRVDAAELWHFHRGAPLELHIGKARHVLGPDIEAGQNPQIVVPKGAWQMARSLGDYTLVGCTVAPGFEFSGFELAAEDFKP